MRVVDLGLMAYHEAEALQLAALAEVQAGAEETLFLVEHPRVITLGRQGGLENLHVDAAHLASQGIELAQTRRGGNITCHFPGQLVAYPIFRVDKRRGGIRKFFHDMEEVVIRTAAHFGVAAERRQGFPGVWTDVQTGGRKICSMGIGVKRGVTYHGLALNVGPDVSLFQCITLCGIGGATPTSLTHEAGPDADPIDMKEVKDVLSREFRTLFAHPALA
jgi:lipoyl(octanoyl) transferase